jgi:hypothetical protein
VSLISEQYLNLNKTLHSESNFGFSGYRYAERILQIIKSHNINSIIDYGAGKCSLSKQLKLLGCKLNIISYEPTNPELTEKVPCDLVICLDVLEHVEPDLLDNVLDDICGLTKQLAFFTIPTAAAFAILPDGRNAHLIQENLNFWLKKFFLRWSVISANCLTETIVIVLKKKDVNDLISLDMETLLDRTMKKYNVMGFYFDGLDINVMVKSKNIIFRIPSRILSVLRLGKRTGICKQLNAPEASFRKLNLTEF